MKTKEQKLYRKLAENIWMARQTFPGGKLTQQAVADKIGLSRAAYVNIEMGRQQLLVHHLIAIAKALRADIRDLLPK